MQRSRPNERVAWPRLQPLVETLERYENGAYLDDRIDSEIGPRSVRGEPRRFELEADEAAVGDREPELGRLDDDRRVTITSPRRFVASAAASRIAASAPFMS